MTHTLANDVQEQDTKRTLAPSPSRGAGGATFSTRRGAKVMLADSVSNACCAIGYSHPLARRLLGAIPFTLEAWP